MNQSASPDQAAAIVAAVELFLGETAAAAPSAQGEVSPWQRAALLEGAGAGRAIEDLEGGMR
jgi:hypothetical protein